MCQIDQQRGLAVTRRSREKQELVDKQTFETIQQSGTGKEFRASMRDDNFGFTDLADIVSDDVLLLYLFPEIFHLNFMTISNQFIKISFPAPDHFVRNSANMRAWIPGVQAMID